MLTDLFVGESLEAAVHQSICKNMPEGSGGLISIGKDRVVMAMNTTGKECLYLCVIRC